MSKGIDNDLAKLYLAQEIARARSRARGLSIEEVAEIIAKEMGESDSKLLVKCLQEIIEKKYGQKNNSQQ